MKIDIKRAWTDPEYRATLSPEDVRGLPPNPAGEAELTEAELDAITGGMGASAQGWLRPPISWSCPQPTEYGSCRCPSDDFS